MTFDKLEHKKFVLEVMAQVQYPGQLIDLAYEVKKAIESAEIKETHVEDQST